MEEIREQMNAMQDMLRAQQGELSRLTNENAVLRGKVETLNTSGELRLGLTELVAELRKQASHRDKPSMIVHEGHRKAHSLQRR